jgi:tRNA-dihydrouridine synthase
MNSFGGFDYGISPFVRTLQGQRYKPSKVMDLKHQGNAALTVFPQILTNQVDDFIHLANVFFDMGYPIINLNMGCPVPTSAGRGRGAGLLPEIDYVDRLLDQVLEKIPNRLSIKTRVGLEAEDDLLKMTEVFNRYPLHEVIIHPRTAAQKYQGQVNHDAFATAAKKLRHDVVYSGDIFNLKDFKRVQARHPQINKWMVGRGILRDPKLISKLRSQSEPSTSNKDFYRELAHLYQKRDLSTHIILTRLKTLALYLGMGSDFPKPIVRGLRKAKTLADFLSYLPADNALLQ